MLSITVEPVLLLLPVVIPLPVLTSTDIWPPFSAGWWRRQRPVSRHFLPGPIGDNIVISVDDGAVLLVDDLLARLLRYTLHCNYTSVLLGGSVRYFKDIYTGDFLSLIREKASVEEVVALGLNKNCHFYIFTKIFRKYLRRTRNLRANK